MLSLRRSLALVLLFATASSRADDAMPSAAAVKRGIDARPDPAAVQRYGPAYRFPQDGWTVLHIEGEPYERGYQHGRLMSSEIAAHLRCFATMLSPKAPADDWNNTRRLVNALFLRRIEKEFLEEMRGIADGATEAGNKFYDRPIDLVDIVALNCWPEIETLDSALEATPTGLEGIKWPHGQPRAMPKPRPEHCSAFAATGPATADGKVVFGHITMFGLYPANFYNVWLDIKPAKGQRMMICGFPGAIQSGMDYYLNDAGILIAETTIGQTRFDVNGKSQTSRIRQAIQYAKSIDDAVDILKDGNNGLYANEWILADVNTNEIALFELGTAKSKLHRSSKNEWIGGTTGFYWGCNNTKDLELRLETIPSVSARPANLVFRPSERDRVWQQLYHKHKGKIGVEFGFEAFTTPPIAAFPSLDAKFTTSDLAKDLKSWALYGPPRGRTWMPTQDELKRYPEIRPLVSNPWTLLHGKAPPASDVVAIDVPTMKPSATKAVPTNRRGRPLLLNQPAWRGTILPQTDGDIWLAAAFADYERIVAAEKAREAAEGHDKAASHDAFTLDLFAPRSTYLSTVRAVGDVALVNVKSDVTRDEWYRIASGKGVLALNELRSLLGDAVFDEAMDSFGRKHAGSRVTTTQFQSHMEQAAGKPLAAFFDEWIKGANTPSSLAKSSGASIASYMTDHGRTIIVYGTLGETPTNREAAESLQKLIRETRMNYDVAIKTDAAVTDDDIRNNHVLLIGRPETNRIVDRYRAALPIPFGDRSFTVRKNTYANPGSGIVVAAENPLNPQTTLVVFAGLSPDATFHLPATYMRERRAAQVMIVPQGGTVQPFVLP